ncbi:hypothetical protein Hypma_010903 [Hypsizygus marmoreus]|uniref:Uncharacterized protein n=1 Tax=Hypsizygus marmoreus TaxID=39966 RepID=A0A369JHS2_HYPMA|nr:hypothetical protein Hypma_010903 [Hypsizygus marmoreus]
MLWNDRNQVVAFSGTPRVGLPNMYLAVEPITPVSLITRIFSSATCWKESSSIVLNCLKNTSIGPRFLTRKRESHCWKLLTPGYWYRRVVQEISADAVGDPSNRAVVRVRISGGVRIAWPRPKWGLGITTVAYSPSISILTVSSRSRKLRDVDAFQEAALTYISLLSTTLRHATRLHCIGNFLKQPRAAALRLLTRIQD